MTLTGATVESPALHCTLRSSWFDLDLDGEPTDAGYRYRYKSVRKAAWFSHAEIMSDSFGKAVEQGRACGAAAHGRETAAGLTRAGAASCPARRAGAEVQCTTPQTMRAPPPPSGAGVSL